MEREPGWPAAVNRRPKYAWLFAAIWLVYLVPTAGAAWSLAGPRRWLAMSLLAAFACCFIGAFALRPALGLSSAAPANPRSPAHIRSRLTGAALTATAVLLVVSLSLIVDEHSMALFIYVAVMATFLLPRRWALGVVIATIAGTTAAQLLTPGWHVEWGIEFEIFVASMAMWGVTQIILRNREIAAAREEITRLAVNDERNRFARDLHDILGHSLTVVAIKAELAGRLIRDDPDRAEAEVSDVERMARQALAEVRSAVAGYRDVTLASELVNARSALSAAGIDADLPTAIDDVPPAHRELFGWVVREGVTNVVRHSGASRCRVRVEPSTVEISDNGPAVCPDRDLPDQPFAGQPRHGLAGLRERAEAAGGSLSVLRAPDAFALTVRL